MPKRYKYAGGGKPTKPAIDPRPKTIKGAANNLKSELSKAFDYFNKKKKKKKDKNGHS